MGVLGMFGGVLPQIAMGNGKTLAKVAGGVVPQVLARSGGKDEARQKALAAALSSTMAPRPAAMMPGQQQGYSPMQSFASAAEPIADMMRQKRIAEILAARRPRMPGEQV